MANNNRPLKAFVRFDGSGRVVSGSLILRRKMPKVGKWIEIPARLCCNPPTYSCITYAILVNRSENVILTYTDCEGNIVTLEINGPVENTFCARAGTASVTGSAILLPLGACVTTTTTTSNDTTGTTTTEVPYGCTTLGEAGNFVVLAHSTITNTHESVIIGDLGLYPGTSVTGFPPGLVIGTEHITDTAASDAKIAATAAFECLGALTPTGSVGADIGGTSINAGVYSVSSSLAVTGTVTLNGQGNPDAIFVFQIPSTFIPAVGAIVEVTNEAQPCNVYWLVGSSATLSVGSATLGNIIALASITLNTNATLIGRAFALTGAVTMDTNAIMGCECSINPCDATTSTTTTAPAATTTTTTTVAATTTTSTTTVEPTTTTTTTEVPATTTTTTTFG